MDTDDDILTCLAQVVHDVTGADPAHVVPTASFIDDLGADWLALAEIVLVCEERLDVDLPDGALRSIVTVGDAVARFELARD